MTPRRAAAWALTACIGLMTGCASPTYLLQATSGHLKLMNAREPISDLLAATDPADPLVGRLELAQDLLAFAEEELALPADGSYETLARTSGGAVTWNVVATPPYELKPQRWCFLIAGCVPYRGYFDAADAERFAERLREQGKDVAVSGARAYSTLGWFSDPLLDTMLSRPDADLAETLFHELAHQALYVPGDATFNESFASFLAEQGVREWMGATGREADFDRWLERQQASEEFVGLLAGTRRSLATFYGTETDPEKLAAGKTGRFRKLEADYAELVDSRWDGRDRFAGWFDPPPNNADLALVGTYTGGRCAFEALWQEAHRDFRRFQALAADRASEDAARRRAWLATACPQPGDKAR